MVPSDEELYACCLGDAFDVVDLLRAMPCFGLKASKADIEDAAVSLGVSLPCSLLEVRSMASYLESLDCPQCEPSVPYARRGVLLSQLEAVEAKFVTSGWLLQHCSEWNEARQAEIEAGKARYLKEDLYGLNNLVIRSATSGGEVKEDLQVLLRELGIERLRDTPSSFSELLNPSGGLVHFFVSHFWGHPFSGTVRALRECARSGLNSGSLAWKEPGLASYWICAMCLNQHQLHSELGDRPEDAPFNMALSKSSHGVVMVIDEDLSPFRRIWCLYEVSRVSDLSKGFALVSAEGVHNAGHGTCMAGKLNMTAAGLSKKLQEVQAFNAKASRDDDKLAILFRIMNPVAREKYPTVDVFKHRIKHPSSPVATIGHMAFTDFDERVRELLSTPLFRTELCQGRVASALQYAMHARVTIRDLRRIVELGGDVNTRLDALIHGERCTQTLLHKVVIDGEETVQYLIEQRADVDTPLLCNEVLKESPMSHFVEHSTPLHTAVYRGNLAAVRLLLEAGANVHAVTQGNSTPLGFTHRPVHNSVEIAMMLLEWNADPHVQNIRGMNYLHAAASAQNVQLLNLFLAQGLSTNCEDVDGSTPLHVAANWGLTDNIGPLIKYGANVHARRHLDNATPLHRAARSGHVAATLLLLQYRADILATDSSGCCATELARFHDLHAVVEVLEVARSAALAQKGADEDVSVTEVVSRTPAGCHLCGG
mmetsp:Transcript_64015/g.152655  ORF Transcript_64015/g.152655 Transcript_64015/m.152655 type:complete len:710 (-) Transcript_64015:52-2181(-)